MDKVGKVKNIDSQIKKLEKEKQEIQKECRHNSTYIKFKDGSSVTVKYCCECEKEVGYPSQQELDKFLMSKT